MLHWRATIELSLWRIADLVQIVSGSDYNDWSMGREPCHTLANWSPDLLLLAQGDTIHPKSALQQQQTTTITFQGGGLYLIQFIAGIWFIVKHATYSMLQEMQKARRQLSQTMTLHYAIGCRVGTRRHQGKGEEAKAPDQLCRKQTQEACKAKGKLWCYMS